MLKIFEVYDGGSQFWYAAETESEAIELHRKFGNSEFDEASDENVVKEMDDEDELSIDDKPQCCREWAAEAIASGDRFIGTTVW